MPAVAHLGVGLAAKKFNPKINVGLLILAAEFIEVIFLILWAAGIESVPTISKPPFAPYSHSLIMGLFWSMLVGGFAMAWKRDARTSIIFAGLVFSHTLLDIIVSPKTAFFPADTGMPILFNYDHTIGLGLWRYETIANVGEAGILIVGLIIYLISRKKEAPESALS